LGGRLVVYVGEEPLVVLMAIVAFTLLSTIVPGLLNELRGVCIVDGTSMGVRGEDRYLLRSDLDLQLKLRLLQLWLESVMMMDRASKCIVVLLTALGCIVGIARRVKYDRTFLGIRRLYRREFLVLDHGLHYHRGVGRNLHGCPYGRQLRLLNY
jgi:hypothetical protein